MLGKSLIAAATSTGAGAEALYIESVFQTHLYTGNSSTQTITNGIDLSGEGGLVWIKSRSDIASHALYDTARGISSGNFLQTNGTNAANTSFVNNLSSFSSTGFTLTTANSSFSDLVNSIGIPYASWTFRKAEKFFDVVTYTGTGSNRTVAHNLGSVPGCIIVKRTDTTGDWQVYHRTVANTDYLVLNTTAGKVTGTTRWNSTTPTSTVFSLGTDATVNASGGTYVAYLFAHDAGGFGDAGTESVIKCGSYTEPTYGTYIDVDLGWEPQWILWKRTNNTGDWYVLDTQRGLTVSGQGLALFPNAITTEGDYFGGIPYLAPNSTGFTVKGGYFGQGSSMIYIAIRRGPMKTPTSGAEVFSTIARSGTGGTTTVTGLGFPPDLWISQIRNTLLNTNVTFDRLRGANKYLRPENTVAEDTSTDALMSFDQDGATLGADTPIIINKNGYNFANWVFRRAPGFFDVVCYNGTTNTLRTVPHNLGVVPELMIFKVRSGGINEWYVYAAPLGNTKYLRLNNDSAATTSTTWLNSTTPTSSVFTLQSFEANWQTYPHIAYLFATCPGVSKVFNYTGTGTTLQVDCGFTSGARLVLIKRTDSTGSWYVWDTARGITSSSDPYLLLNSTAAEVTGTDYIDPYSAGFEISSSAPAEINASGGSYIGLAIA